MISDRSFRYYSVNTISNTWLLCQYQYDETVSDNTFEHYLIINDIPYKDIKIFTIRVR